MSLSRRRYAVSRRLGLLGVLFSALLALTLFPPSVATAQEVKQIKLNEKRMQGFIAVSEDMAKLSDAFRIYLPYRWGCEESGPWQMQVPGLREACISSQPEGHLSLPST
jgi:hypothetical protein